jgi:uncharacterized protein (DUF983 family)
VNVPRADSIPQVLLRGLRKRCPRCGQGPLYRGWHQLLERCPACGLEYQPFLGNTWFFMYVTTAGLTGLLVLVMLLVRPPTLLSGQLMLFPAALLLIGGTLPYRKAVAIAIEYLIDRATQEPPPAAR